MLFLFVKHTTMRLSGVKYRPYSYGDHSMVRAFFFLSKSEQKTQQLDQSIKMARAIIGDPRVPEHTAWSSKHFKDFSCGMPQKARKRVAARVNC